MSEVRATVQHQEASQGAEDRGHPEVQILPELLEMDQPPRSGRGMFTEAELRRGRDDGRAMPDERRGLGESEV